MITNFKIFENVNNFEVKALTAFEFKDLYWKIYPDGTNLTELIHYFSWNLESPFSEKHNTDLRLITAYNDTDILGVSLFAWWESNKHYAMSYLSTNKKFFKSGISKKILEKLFDYFSKIHPTEVLNFSGYSIDGWQYLHNRILELSKKYNVEIRENAIEYITDWNDDKRKLYDKSREEIKTLYGED